MSDLGGQLATMAVIVSVWYIHTCFMLNNSTLHCPKLNKAHYSKNQWRTAEESACTLFLPSCCSMGSAAVWGRLLVEDEGSLSLSLSLSLNHEKGMQVGMDAKDSEGEMFGPDSSSSSAEPLDMRRESKLWTKAKITVDKLHWGKMLMKEN